MWYAVIFTVIIILMCVLEYYIDLNIWPMFIIILTCIGGIIVLITLFVSRPDYNYKYQDHISYQTHLNELRYNSTYKEELNGVGNEIIKRNVWLDCTRLLNTKWWADDFIPDEGLEKLRYIR